MRDVLLDELERREVAVAESELISFACDEFAIDTLWDKISLGHRVRRNLARIVRDRLAFRFVDERSRQPIYKARFSWREFGDAAADARTLLGTRPDQAP